MLAEYKARTWGSVTQELHYAVRLVIAGAHKMLVPRGGLSESNELNELCENGEVGRSIVFQGFLPDTSPHNDDLAAPLRARPARERVTWSGLAPTAVIARSYADVRCGPIPD